jgi:hypothetical protein
LRKLAGTIVAAVLCVLIYWPGLRAWFQMDDFAWLSLHLEITDFRSFLGALFRPLAQGTIRPWSERLFFIAGWHLFGMEAAPYRVIAFATMFANFWLLAEVTRKLTKSRVAAVLAPVLWVCNGNLYTPMSWTSAYNQILCAMFLLAAFLLWIKYTETGKTRWYAWQWVVFVLGFGALEINLVYPALAAMHAFCFARKFLWRTLPMFAVSVIFVVAHRLSAPAQRDDVYRMYFDASILETLATFFGWAISVHRYASFRGLDMWPFFACAAVVGIALLALCVRREWLPLFCVAWFVIVLTPVLPLRNHRSDYYVTIPVIGLAILGAYGIARWPRVGAVAALAYAIPGIWMAHGMSQLFYDHSTRVKHLVRGVAGAAKQHPGDVLLISGVDNTLFWRGWYDPVFRTLNIPAVYLTGDTRPHVERTRGSENLDRYFLADTIAVHWLKQGKAHVYEIQRDARLREVTQVARARMERSVLVGPDYLDVRSPITAIHVREGWWPSEPNHRWMSQRAVVELRGPTRSPGELAIRGWCAPQHVEAGPVQLTVGVDGTPIRTTRIDAGNLQFDLRLPLPEHVTGKPLMRVELKVDRPLFIPSDGRHLGPGFGTFAVSP